MDPLLLILLIETLLLSLLLGPLLMTRRLIRRNQPLKALPWAKTTLALGRVFPFCRGIGNLNVAACYVMADDFTTALPHAEQAVNYFALRSSPKFRANRAIGLSYLGIALSRTGQMQQAEQRLDEALSLGIRNPSVRAHAEIIAANVYLNRGRLADAGRLMEQVLAMPKLDEERRSAAENLLAGQKYYSEDFAGGLTLARQALQRKTTPARFLVAATINAQFCLTELGELREAQALEAGILSQISEAPRNIQSAALRASANLALKLGNLDRAREQAERAALLDSTPNAYAASLLIQAEVFALRQNFQRAASLTDAVLRSEAIDFYQRRARALQGRLSAPPLSALQ